MKKALLILALLAAALPGIAKDKAAKQKDTTGVKTGINFGPLPAIGYSTDVTASGDRAIAVGNRAHASGSYSVAMGYNAKASSSNVTSIWGGWGTST